MSAPAAAASSRQLTIRAVATGMVLGGTLSLCNIYMGLKVGWGMGMSITAALIGFGFWQLMRLTGRCEGLSIYESNINQTAASSGAAISSAGLVAPIPALTLLTGQTLSWVELVMWTFSVCLVGIIVAVGLRRQLIVVDSLTFPGGVATAETLTEIYAHGAEAMVRIRMLAGGALIAAAIKIAEHLAKIPRWPIPGWFSAKPGAGLEKAGISGVSAGNLGFALEPTTLMYGVGVLIGPRVGISMMLGAVVAWAWLAPVAFEAGWVPPWSG